MRCYRPTRLIALLAFTALAASGCGRDSGRYVVNDRAELYFKVPRQWVADRLAPTVFNGSQYVGEPWGYYFGTATLGEGNNQVSLTGLGQPGQSPTPVGLVTVGQLERGVFDDISIAELRSITLNVDNEDRSIDPLQLLIDEEDDVLGLIAINQIERDGLRGFRLRYAVPNEAGDPTSVYERTVVLHDATRTLYVFRIACTTECFIQNRAAIDKIVNSLRIREDQP